MSRVLIIDDEKDAREIIKQVLSNSCPGISVCGEAENLETGYRLIRTLIPDIILLDISFPDGSGFDLLDKCRDMRFKTIFITAYDQFALKAFRYNAVNYLLKPLNPLELTTAMDKIIVENGDDYSSKILQLLQNIHSGKADKIMLSSLEGSVLVGLDQIIRLESDGSYTTFYMTSGDRQICTKPLKEFEELIGEEFFFRIHQSHIVNLHFVRKILKEDGGYALMEGGAKIPIARRRKEEFNEAISNKFHIKR